MHPYQTTQTGPKPFVSPVMLSSQLGFALVAFEYSRISETLFSPPAMAFTALALSLSLHHRHQGSNLVLWLANFILLAICTAINAQSLLVTGDVLPLVSFFSTVFSFLLSLIVAMPTQFAEFRTICHLNASLGSLSLLWSLPLGLHVGCAFFTFQIMLRNRCATGLSGKVSLICFTSVVMVCLLPRLWSPPAPIQLLFADAEASAAGAASGDLKLTGISVELVDEVTVVLAQQRAFAGGLLLSTLFYFVYADALRASIAWVQLLPIVLWLCLSIGTLVAAGWPSLAYDASSTTLSWSSLLFVMLLALGLRLYFSIDCPSSIHINGGLWDSALLAGANMLIAWLLPGRLQLVSFEEEKGKEWKRNMSASAEVRNALDLESNGVTLLFVVRPWPFLSALLVDGELGLGESFVAGHWREGPRGQGSLVAVLHALLPCMVDWRVQALRYCFPSFWLRQTLFAASFGRFDRKQAENSIAQHYDVSNDLFEAFLGPDMVYTCAKFTANKNSSSEEVRSLTSEVRARGDVALAKAQVWKTERILELCNSPRTLLDIGCGWGYLVSVARAHGISATGFCNSKNMVAYAQAKYPPSWFLLQDYRDIPAMYSHDAVTAVEVIEAIPAALYPDFVASCSRALRVGGRVVMQVIHAFPFNNPVASKQKPEMRGSFVTTHIFPGQQIPHLEALHEAFWKTGQYKLVYSESDTQAYTLTLQIWRDQLEKRSAGFPAPLIAKFRYYFAFCEVGFQTELLQLSRVVYEKRTSLNPVELSVWEVMEEGWYF